MIFFWGLSTPLGSALPNVTGILRWSLLSGQHSGLSCSRLTSYSELSQPKSITGLVGVGGTVADLQQWKSVP